MSGRFTHTKYSMQGKFFMGRPELNQLLDIGLPDNATIYQS